MITWKKVKERALIKAGEKGNENDYIEELVDGVNSVLKKIVSFAKNNIKYIEIESKDGIIEMPSDIFQFMELKDKDLREVSFQKVDNIRIKVNGDGIFQLKYKSFLDEITEETEDDYVIEIEEVAKECLIVGLATEISIDNPEYYDILANEYNNLLSNLSMLPETIDDYGKNGIYRIEGWYY
jgi:hypothetical protein